MYSIVSHILVIFPIIYIAGFKSSTIEVLLNLAIFKVPFKKNLKNTEQ